MIEGFHCFFLLVVFELGFYAVVSEVRAEHAFTHVVVFGYEAGSDPLEA